MSAYSPPPHLSVVLVGKLAGNRDCAFWVEAVRTQLQQHAAPAWGLPAPGVFLYDENQFTPSSEGAVIAIVDDDGDDTAAGFHSIVGNVPFGLVDLGQSDAPSVVLSHEALELWANASLDRWAPGPSGLDYAMELCDPVQEDGYSVAVELFGDRRMVEVSNFVMPGWFGLDGRTAWRGDLARFVIAPGGYAITRNEEGEIVFFSHAGGARIPSRKLAQWGRTGQLVRGQS